MSPDADSSTDVGQDQFVSVSSADLPVFCPNPTMPLWSSHPRVFLEIGDRGDAMCPYCGTRYRLMNAARDLENRLQHKAKAQAEDKADD